jgi:hypothetical protein
VPAFRWLLTISILWMIPAGGALAQDASTPSPLATDRPGFLFSSLTVGRGVLQAELGIPAVTLNRAGGVDTRFTSLFGLVRYGLTPNLELRLDSPVYNETRVTAGGLRSAERGFGDLEVGAKWHLLDNQGARPFFALIPSVIVPVGEKDFSARRPVYQLNAMAEWNLKDGWGIGALAGYLNGPSGGNGGNGRDHRYGQETFAVSLGRSLPSPKWSAYGEAVWVVTSLAGTSDSSFLGGGVKYLAANDVQLDLSFDRGLSAGSPDWLFGLGLAVRF